PGRLGEVGEHALRRPGGDQEAVEADGVGRRAAGERGGQLVGAGDVADLDGVGGVGFHEREDLPLVDLGAPAGREVVPVAHDALAGADGREGGDLGEGRRRGRREGDRRARWRGWRWGVAGGEGGGRDDQGQETAAGDPNGAQPLMPVRVMPWMNVRGTKKNRMMIGSVTQTDIAIISPQAVAYSKR